MLTAARVLVIVAYALMIDLKGISTDEGIRLAIMNGGEPFGLADPYLDAGLTPGYSWQTLCAELSSSVRTDDVLGLHDFVVRSAMTFTRPFSNPVLVLPELEKSNLRSVEHEAYLEFFLLVPGRDELAGRMATLGFPNMKEVRIHHADGKTVLNDWRFLVFSRP